MSTRIDQAPRVMATQAIQNCRDFGGYPVASGGRLVRGRLFRSGEHARATPEDLALLNDLGVRCFVDLRGAKEREKAPCLRYQPFTGKVLVTEGETAEMAPHQEAAQTLDADAARRTLTARYRTLPFRPALVEVYAKYLRMLAESGEASVVYCSAGKDRTGLLAALVHTMLGVHRDDMMADYLLTNEVGVSAKTIEDLRSQLSKRFGPLSTEAARVVLSVEPAYLEAAFGAIRERFTTIDNYLENMLGVTPGVRAGIASKLTTSP